MSCVWNSPVAGRTIGSFRFGLAAAFAICAICVNNAVAVPIPVNNHSFENANLSGGGQAWSDAIDIEAGGADPEFWIDDPLNANNAFAEFIGGFSSDGANHLGVAANSVTQTLSGVSLQPNMQYTLTVGLGNRDGFTDVNNMSVFGLNAGATNLGRTTFNASTIPAGGFSDSTFQFFSGSSPAAGDLQIVLTNGGPNRSHFDNIRLDVSDVVTIPFSLIVDRDTGNLTLDNQSGAAVNFAGLSVLSPAGTLNNANWTSISGNYDAPPGNESVSSDEWLIFASSSTDLSEGTLGSGSIANGASVNLGSGVWEKFYDEDVTFEYLNASTGLTVNARVEFVGNGGVGFEQGDINFDGDINSLDWPTVRDNFNSDFTGQTAAVAYGMGDLTGDLLVNTDDVFLFKTLFEAANPGVPFSSVVPEPTSAALFALAAIALAVTGRRAIRFAPAVLIVLGMYLAATPAMAVQIPVNNHSFEDANLMADGGQTWSNAIDVDPTDAVPPVDPDYWVDDPLNGGDAFSEYIDGFASEGINHLGVANMSTVTQTLAGVSLLPDSVYTLTVGVGNRGGQTAGGNQSVFGLNAGATDLGRTNFDASTLTVGTFADSSFVYVTGTSPVAGDLQIALAVASGDRAHYDNVRLERTATDQANILTLTIGGGGAVLSNNSIEGAQHNIDYYEITTPSGTLNAGNWNSLQDVDFENNGAPGNGNGWEELGNADGSIIAEFYLQGSSIFTPGTSANLGAIYGGTQDIQLTYRTADGTLQSGLVLYDLSSPFSADLDVDVDVDGRDFLLGQRQGLGASFYTNWQDEFGSGIPAGAAATAIPEPSGILLAGLAVACICVFRSLRMSLRPSPCVVRCLSVVAVVTASLALAGIALASKTTDRDYRFGDDPEEDASANTLVGSGATNVNPGWTLDSQGPSGAFLDLQLLVDGGDPMYVDVSGRTGNPGDLGVAFDGDDYVQGLRLGRPSTSATDINQGGPLDYSGVSARGFQLWVNPSNNTTMQSIVNDANMFGVQITADGFWSSRFGGGDTVSTIPVQTGVWSHVMVVSPLGAGSTMYIDGIAATSAAGGYGDDNTPLDVGGRPDGLGAVIEGFTGTLDDLELFVLGEPPFSTVSYGTFDLATDNEFVAALGLTPGDVDGDHDVDDDDVTEFISHWREVQLVNGLRVGDLNSRANGDLNFDGIVNFADWARIRANHTDGAALDLGSLLGVPEPTSALLALAGIAAMWLPTRRR